LTTNIVGAIIQKIEKRFEAEQYVPLRFQRLAGRCEARSADAEVAVERSRGSAEPGSRERVLPSSRYGVPAPKGHTRCGVKKSGTAEAVAFVSLGDESFFYAKGTVV